MLTQYRFTRIKTVFKPGAAVAALVLSLLAGSANAALQSVGPVDPVIGFPDSYTDTNGLQLTLCLDQTPLCLSQPPDSTQPAFVNPQAPVPPDAITDANFPDEAFYWSASSTMPTNNGGQALLVMALEGAFANGPVAAGEQITFARFRFRIDNLVAGKTYTIIHPFGRDKFVATAAGRRGINVTLDLRSCFMPGSPSEFGVPVNGRIGPFLVWDPALQPTAPAGFIGDPAINHRVVGSPLDTNFFRINGPNIGGPGINSITTRLFSVSGKVYQPPAPQ